MEKDIKVFDMLISCPSDVSEYVVMLEKKINHFNNFFGRRNDVIIRCRNWSTDAYSELGASPQKLVNEQLVDSSDMAVAVFWTRFGTATESYGSGTEEEIERMLSENKQVFLYFLNKPFLPSEIDWSQYQKMEEFKEKHKKDGIFFSASDENTLASKFRDDLELYFSRLIREQELKKSSEKKENLLVDERLKENVRQEKPYKIYISHSEQDKEYAEAFVKMLEGIHIGKEHMLCSSFSGYGLPENESMQESLLGEFREYNLYMVFLLSDNFYKSAICLNEMGAAWVLQLQCENILLPGFEFKNVKGVIGLEKISTKLDEDKYNVLLKLHEMAEQFAGLFDLELQKNITFQKNIEEFLDRISTIKRQKLEHMVISINGGCTLTSKDHLHEIDNNKKEGIYPEESCEIDPVLADLQYKHYHILENTKLKNVPKPLTKYWRLRLYIFLLKDKSGKRFLPLQLPRYESILTVPHIAISWFEDKRYTSVKKIKEEVYRLGHKYDDLIKEMEKHQFYQMGIFTYDVEDKKINDYIEYKCSTTLRGQWSAYWIEEVKVTTLEPNELVNLYDPFYYHGYRYLPIDENGFVDTSSRYVKLTEDGKGIWFFGKPLSSNIRNLINNINDFDDCTYELPSGVLLSERGCILDGIRNECD